VLQDWGIDTWAYPDRGLAGRKAYELLGKEIEEMLEDPEPEKLFKHLVIEKDEATKIVNFIQLSENDYITVEETLFFEED
jgi:hypothetical protein